MSKHDRKNRPLHNPPVVRTTPEEGARPPAVPEGKPPATPESLGAKPVELPRAYVVDGRCDNPACRSYRSEFRYSKILNDGRITRRRCRVCGNKFDVFEKVRK